jgi:hypothetical protein
MPAVKPTLGLRPTAAMPTAAVDPPPDDVDTAWNGDAEFGRRLLFWIFVVSSVFSFAMAAWVVWRRA